MSSEDSTDQLQDLPKKNNNIIDKKKDLHWTNNNIMTLLNWIAIATFNIDCLELDIVNG